jgi:glycosyltransferase involved in cell wall biosynthesis
LLAEAGHRIVVVDVMPHDEASDGFWTHRNVDRVRANPLAIGANLFQRAKAAAKFWFIVRQTIKRRRPHVVVAYDPYGMAAAGIARALNVWHFHEMFDAHQGMGFLNRAAARFAYKNARNAAIVIFPDEHRAGAFAQVTSYDTPIEVVNNCPRRLDGLPNDLLRPKLAGLGINPTVPIVLFQGWIGPTYCIEQTIISMTCWPEDACFVLVGPVEFSYREQLTRLAAEFGVAERVVFLGRVPYQELFAYTVGADIGLSVISDKLDTGLNLKYSSGASNKRFEYMACGLPQLANKGQGMHELIEARGVGVLVSHDEPADIGNAIGALITDKPRLKAMGSAARNAHLDLFNYEHQFSSIATRIGTLCDTRIS